MRGQEPTEPPAYGAVAQRVLLVDDDQTLSRTLARILRRAGYEVETACDGLQGTAALACKRHGAIVTDLQMPGMSGLELLREVRARDLDVPVVIMTGSPDVASAVRAIEYGAFRYLVKPFDPEQLRQVLDEATKFHQLAVLRRRMLELPESGGKALGDLAALEARFELGLRSLWTAVQPVLSWRDRRVFAYETLLRTEEPNLLDPRAMLDAAERLRRSEEVGRAQRASVAHVMEATAPPTNLLVNVHPLDLLDEELYAETPLARAADRVILEITEQIRPETVPDLKGRVARLRRLGYRIALDDLGAGYAGLGSFVLLEPDIIKIDMSLVRGIDGRAINRSLVGGLVAACRDLGIEVIAEGVETEAERDCLLELGCDLLQGYLFARPDRPFPVPRW
jgi:EAL domain-containing protein (putative c-di-GMP-specific phosphodiesterase class I)